MGWGENCWFKHIVYPTRNSNLSTTANTRNLAHHNTSTHLLQPLLDQIQQKLHQLQQQQKKNNQSLCDFAQHFCVQSSPSYSTTHTHSTPEPSHSTPELSQSP